MKLIAFATALLAARVSAGTSFQNTSPLLIVSPLLTESTTNFEEKYDQVSSRISDVLSRVCQTSSENVIYLKVHGLDLSDLNSLNPAESSNKAVIKHVLYDQTMQLPIPTSCKGSVLSIDSKKYTDTELIDLLDGSESVKVVDIINDKDLINTVNNIINIKYRSNLIIQGLPNTSPNEFRVQKRNTEHEEAEEDYDKIQEDLDDSFAEVNDLLSESDDEEIHIVGNGKAEKFVPPTGSLFNRYSFFSSGIWMAIIVSGFLISVVMIAFTWLNSIQISYGAFEKPVNVAKKTN